MSKQNWKQVHSSLCSAQLTVNVGDKFQDIKLHRRNINIANSCFDRRLKINYINNLKNTNAFDKIKVNTMKYTFFSYFTVKTVPKQYESGKGMK